MNFDRAVSHVIHLEGSFIDDPRDFGGRTKYGISQRAYPGEDIANLTIDRAKYLYKRDYWDKCRCDELPPRLAYYVFDAAVNQGVKAAITILQQVLKVNVDGAIGPVTIKAAQSKNPEIPALYMSQRAIRYSQLAQFNIYGLGWLKRIFLVAEYQ